jgi:hypothetical protein
MSKDEIAYFLLHLTLGANLFLHGFSRLIGNHPTFAAYMCGETRFWMPSRIAAWEVLQTQGPKLSLSSPETSFSGKRRPVHRTLFARIKVLLKRMGRTSNVD